MTVTRVGEYTAVNGGAAASSAAIVTDGSVQAGDLLLAWVHIATSTGVITPPAGWTEITLATNSTTNHVGRLYWKAAAGPSETHTWTFSASQRFAAVCQALRGADTTTPVHAAGQVATSIGTSHVGPSVVTSIATWVASGYALRPSGVPAPPYWTPDAAEVERVEVCGTNTTANIALSVADAGQLAAGTYQRTGTSSISQVTLVSTVAIKPAGTSGVAPSGIAVPVTVGQPAASIPSVTPQGLAVPAALGGPTVAIPATAPDGLAAPVAVGQPGVSVPLASPGGITLAIAFGEPTVGLVAAGPTALSVPMGFGEPTVLALGVAPDGVSTPLIVGSPEVALGLSAEPAGFAVAVAFGLPTVGSQPAPHAAAHGIAKTSTSSRINASRSRATVERTAP